MYDISLPLSSSMFEQRCRGCSREGKHGILQVGRSVRLHEGVDLLEQVFARNHRKVLVKVSAIPTMLTWPLGALEIEPELLETHYRFARGN